MIGDRAIFAADDGVHGLEPWVTDGTPEGTHLVADVMAGPRPLSQRGFGIYGGELFFNAGRPPGRLRTLEAATRGARIELAAIGSHHPGTCRWLSWRLEGGQPIALRRVTA